MPMSSRIFDWTLKSLFLISCFVLLLLSGWYVGWRVITESVGGEISIALVSFLVGLTILGGIVGVGVRLSRSILYKLATLVAFSFISFIGGAVVYLLNIDSINATLERNFVHAIRLISKIEPPAENLPFNSEGYAISDFEYPVLVKFVEHPVSVVTRGSNNITSVIVLRDVNKNVIGLPFFSSRNSFVSYDESDNAQTVSFISLEFNDNLIGSAIENNTLASQVSQVDVLWRTKSAKTPLHHWGDVFDGRIYVPGKKLVRIPNQTSESFLHTSFSNCGFGKSASETIEIFSLNDGQFINSIDILPILARVHNPSFRQFLKDCEDPIHLNDVVIVKFQRHADFFPGGKIGDLLISMRTINTIALLDRENYEVKWHSSVFAAQHSPRITDYGTIMVFDNLASNVAHGQSRITEIDIKSNTIVGIWEATGGNHFESETAGRLQLIGDRVFVQESNKGRLFELVCRSRPISISCENKLILEVPSDEVFVLDVLSNNGN